MSRAASTAVPAGRPAPVQDHHATRGAFDLRAALELLTDRAADRLTVRDREFLAQADRQASMLAQWGATVAEGIGCLVANDGENAGAFRERQPLAELLWLLGSNFENIKALIELRVAVAPEPPELSAAIEPQPVRGSR